MMMMMMMMMRRQAFSYLREHVPLQQKARLFVFDGTNSQLHFAAES